MTFKNNTSDISSEFFFYTYTEKSFFLIPTQYSVLYIQSRKHLIKKSPTLLLLYTDIHTNLYCIFLFSMLDVKSKEKLTEDRKKSQFVEQNYTEVSS